MSAEKPKLDLLFEAAISLESAAQRAAFLQEKCGDDHELRGQLEQLLLSDGQAGSFLETPPVKLEAKMAPRVAGNNLVASLQAGLAPAFDENDAVVVGSAGHSVLKALARTVNLPSVALREGAADGPEPIVRPTSPEMPGKNSDSRYQLQGEIARGGMGAILKARDVDLGRDLAIKVLLDEHKDTPQVIQRFVEEAQIGGQLQHPGIAPVYELGTFADQRPFFSMKLVKGETLSRLLAERIAPTEDRGRFLGIFEQVCQTMAYAHSRGVIHRDLKPANVMVGAFGEVQVMDWGLAKVLPTGGVADEKKAHDKQQGQSIIQTLRSKIGSDAPGVVGSFGSQTQMGSIMGTPAYMPPEQALGEIDNLDERADVFGLGAILCEILTGQPPYVGTDGTQVFRLASRGKLNDCFERLDSCGADSELVTLTKHCLELEPVDRPRDAGVLAERVSGYLESVEAKLRESEVERAAQAARADAEAAQAAAERQRAEAESQRAEAESAKAQAESARASEESKRRRTSLALAASVLLLVGVGSGGWLYLLHQKADRQTAEADAQRKHAREMQTLAEQRDEQRKVAEQAKTTAEQAEQQAITQKNRANLAAEITQQNLYYAQMHLAQQAWRDHRGIGHMQDLLANWLPDDKQPLCRQWEWFYINSLPYQNQRTLPKQEINSGRCSVAWHVSSNRLAEGTANGAIRIWDVDREQITLMIQGPQQELRYWDRVWFAWSPDGDLLAACGRDGTVHVWETVSGTKRLSVKTHNSPGVSVNFDSTGRQVAVCGSDGSIKIVNTQTEEIRPGVTHPSGVTAVAWSFDHRQVAMGHFDGTVTESEIQTGAEITSIPAHSSAVYCLAWSPDGRRLATASAAQFYALIWDLDSRQSVVDPLRHSHAILSMAWTADGHKLATGSADQTVKLWKTDNGQETATLRSHRDDVCALVWGPEDRHLASAGRDGSVKIWTSLQDQESLVLPGTIRTTSIAWSPDGKRLAAGSDDGLIRIWEPARSDTLVSLKLPDPGKQFYQQFGLIRMLAWSPDGTYLASADTDGKVEVWNVASRENVVLPLAESGPAWCVTWSPDGKDLAAGFENGTVHIFEGVKQRPSSRVLQAHQKRVFTLAWSPLGDRLASGSYSENSLRVWDPDQGTEVMVMDNRGSVMGLAWSPDGKQLASSSGLRHVKTWDAVTGQELQTMQGHHDYVNAIVWSPDGSRLASAGFDNSVRIWDPATGAEACVLRGNNGFFHDVSWNSDGARLAAAGSDGNVWIWDATRGFERDTTPRALPYIDRAVSAGNARGDDLRWYVDSYIRAGKLQEALDAATHDAAALAHLSKVAREKHFVEFSDEVAARTITRLEQQLATEPHNVTIATALADLLLERSHCGWTVLEPVEMKSTGGATLTLEPDGSILASGANTSGDLYTVSAVNTLDRITSIRLEALPDASLPEMGPGRHSSGNFQLSEIRISIRTGDHATDLSPLPIESASASFDFKAWDADIRGTIDQSLDKVWHVWGQTGKPHEAVFLLKNTPNVVKDFPIVVELLHKEFSEGINLGRFRLSATDDPAAFAREKLRLAAMRSEDPWLRLACGRWLARDFQSAAISLIGVFQTTVDDAQRADILETVSSDAELLAEFSRQLDGHPRFHWLNGQRLAALGKWAEAEAAFQRVIELDAGLATKWVQTGYWKVEGYPYGMNTAQPPEANPDPLQPVGRPDKDGQLADVRWQAVNPASNGRFNLGAQRACHYVLTRIWSAVEQEIALQMGDDDNLRLFLNDELLFESVPNGGTASPKEHETAITLRPGWNSVLFKLQNQFGSCSLIVNFSSDRADLANARLGNRFREAMQLATAGKQDEVLAILKDLLGENSQNAHQYARRAEAYSRLQQWKLAEADYQRTVELEPKNADRWQALGDFRQSRRQLEPAIAAFTRSLDILPSNGFALYRRAYCYADLGRWEEAMADINLAVEHRNDRWKQDFQVKRANLWCRQARWQEAARDMQAVAATESATAKTWSFSRDLAVVELMTEDLEAWRLAVAEMDKRLGDSPGADQARWLALTTVAGPATLTTEQHGRLLKMAEEKLTGRDADWKPLLQAALLYRTGKFQEAADLFDKNASGPALAAFQFLAAMAHHKLGNHDLATKLLTTASEWVTQQEAKAEDARIPADHAWQDWAIYKSLERETAALQNEIKKQ